MILTPKNYIEQSCHVNFDELSEALSKGHNLALNAFKDEQAAYKGNKTVKTVMDHYLTELNEAIAKQKPVKRKSSPKKKRSTTLKPVIGDVEVISEEIRFIRRFLWLDGKTRSKESIKRLLFSLQKAMVERRIRKNSAYAQEIQKIHDYLWRLAVGDHDMLKIELDPKLKKQYQEIASSQSVKEAVRLLKRFIPLQGKLDIDDKVIRLHKQAIRLIGEKKPKMDSPYHPRIMQMIEALENYIEDIEYDEPDLEFNLQYLGKLPSVMSSEQLLSMEFETIGLQGKWKELIGDPSVGFSMMVFGQPKSGKSTLMIEFAQYLAENHGRTLYVAIEEGFGYTLKDKIQRVGATSSQLSFAADMPQKLDDLDFVFIDSISRGGMEIEDLIKLQEQYPMVGFIYIFHTTKDGRFRGGNHYAHEVDVIVEVTPEEIKSSGRFTVANVIENLIIS
ncbi:MAG: hypothetical protein DWQ21_07240 [Bacteroidetes bacterium]|nr:MAG: hypothetical protein DWQ21_07240 [Bacteroidota bacterium]REK64309.1 MAG: hypothetical protein DWQ49_01825 [Bacteroidota bacterium]